MRSLVFLISCAGLALTSCKKHAPAEPASGASGALNGEYTITSATLPGGSRGAYPGNVKIQKTGDYYGVEWSFDHKQSYRGVGIEEGEFLSAGWGMAEDSGVAVYQIAGGQLNGRWAASNGSGKLGKEEATGPSGLNGSYTIVAGRTPNGDSYDGQLAITPSGNMYRVIRRAGADTFHGAAVKKGSRLFVGWAKGGGAVMVYTVKGDKLSGQWAQPGSSQLGTEFLTRR